MSPISAVDQGGVALLNSIKKSKVGQSARIADDHATLRAETMCPVMDWDQVNKLALARLAQDLGARVPLNNAYHLACKGEKWHTSRTLGR